MSDPTPNDLAINDGAVVQALIVDAARRVLLFATNPGACIIWTVPGGALASGEDAAAAIRRILHSATGQHVESLTGPPTATQGRAGGGRDLYYLCPVEAFQLSRGDTLTSHLLQQARWWTCQELDTAQPHTSPKDLTAVTSQYLRS